MLARQAALRRANRFATPALRALNLKQQATPLGRRRLSFPTFRRQKTPENLPVYFPRPVSNTSTWSTVRWRVGRTILTAVVLYSCWQIFVVVVFDPLLDWADAEWDALSEKEKEEVQNTAEEDDAILFLPFPFTTKEVKQPPYRGSDPEWATFVKVNKDTKLQKNIKDGLADEIRRGVEKNPSLMKLLGGGGVSVRKQWLDIIYPPRPPPKHYVAGIIVDDEGIFWGDREIDSTAASHVDKAIYPKAVALTAWTFVNFLFKQTVQDIGEALGFVTPPTRPIPQWPPVEQRSQGPGPVSQLPGTAQQTPKVFAQPDKPHGNLPIGTGDVIGTLFGSETQLDPRIQAAIQAASLTFVRNWKPTKSPPNRGCIRVDGVVELKGKTACMAVYVLGWYDPKLHKFMGIQTGLKHLVQLKQRPAPG